MNSSHQRPDDDQPTEEMKRPPSDYKNHREEWLDYLLQWHYGLLSDEQSSQLQHDVEADEQLKQWWNETQQTSQLLAAAVDADVFVADALGDDKDPIDYQSVTRVKPPPKRTPFAKTKRLVAIAACIGWILIPIWHRSKLPAPPNQRLVLTAQEKTLNRENATAQRTIRVEARPVSYRGFPIQPAMISFRVLQGGTSLYQDTARTDSSGVVDLKLPADLVVPPKSKLMVSVDHPGLDHSNQQAGSSIIVPLEPTRCVTHLRSDRSTYAAGEAIYVRSLTLRRQDNLPIDRSAVRFELRRGDDDRERSQAIEGITRRGVGNASFVAPADDRDGKLRLVAISKEGLFPDVSLPIRVLPAQPIKLNKTVRLDRKIYFPGDVARLQVVVTEADHNPVANVDATVEVHAGERMMFQSDGKTDDEGAVGLELKIPSQQDVKDDSRPFAVLRLAHEGTIEARRIELPVVDSAPTITIHTESGSLVRNLENRIYVAVTNRQSIGIACDVELLDEQKLVVDQTRTDKSGLASFRLGAEADSNYSVRVLSGTPFSATQPLPSFMTSGMVLDSGDSVFAADEPIRLVVRSNDWQPFTVQAVCRGKIVGSESVVPGIGSAALDITLPVDASAYGVIRLLLSPNSKPSNNSTAVDGADDQAAPAAVAERLVYRKRSRRLAFSISREKKDSDVDVLRIKTTDENGNPASSVLGVSVIDSNAATGFSISPQRSHHASLETSMLIASEISNADAFALLVRLIDGNRDSDRALDRLLGIQSWRRFQSSQPATPPLPELRQRIVDLLMTDGDHLAKPKLASNGIFIKRQWKTFENAESEINQKMISWLIAWTVFVAGAFMIAVRHDRRVSRTLIAAILILGLCMIGCGHTGDSVGVLPPTSQEQSVSVPDGYEKAISDRDPNENPNRIGPDPLLQQNRQTVQILQSLLDQRNLKNPTSKALASRINTTRQISQPQLRQIMKQRGLNAGEMADQLLNELVFATTEFDAETSVATLQWNPFLETDSDGFVTVEIPADRKIHVQIDGNTADGRIGSYQIVLPE